MGNNYEKEVIFVFVVVVVVVKTTENSTGNPKAAPPKFSPVYRYMRRNLWT